MNKQEEIEFLISVIEHPAKFGIDLFAMLYLRSHCDGYEVSWEEAGVPISANNCMHKNFEDVREAVEFFVNKRHELQLGLDIEAELHKNNANKS